MSVLVLLLLLLLLQLSAAITTTTIVWLSGVTVACRTGDRKFAGLTLA